MSNSITCRHGGDLATCGSCIQNPDPHARYYDRPLSDVLTEAEKDLIDDSVALYDTVATILLAREKAAPATLPADDAAFPVEVQRAGPPVEIRGGMVEITLPPIDHDDPAHDRAYCMTCDNRSATEVDAHDVEVVLLASLNLVAPLRHIFRNTATHPPAQVIDALEVLLEQEVEHAATQVAALLERERRADRERTDASSSEVTPCNDATPAIDANALVGDDIDYWLNNPFMSPELIAEKVRWWVVSAAAKAWDEAWVAHEGAAWVGNPYRAVVTP